MGVQSLPFGAQGVWFTLNMLHSMNRWYDRFLFESCDPKLVSAFRMGYALLLIVYVATWSHSYSLCSPSKVYWGTKQHRNSVQLLAHRCCSISRHHRLLPGDLAS